MPMMPMSAEEFHRLADGRAAAELSLSAWTNRICGLMEHGDWMELLGAVWTVPDVRKKRYQHLPDTFARSLAWSIAPRIDCLRCVKILVDHNIGLPTLGRHACEAGKCWLVLWVHAQHLNRRRRSSPWWTGAEWNALRERLFVSRNEDELACIAILSYIGRDVGYLCSAEEELRHRVPTNERTRTIVQNWNLYEPEFS